MKKTRMTASNVEELMEIVRSIQSESESNRKGEGPGDSQIPVKEETRAREGREPQRNPSREAPAVRRRPDSGAGRERPEDSDEDQGRPERLYRPSDAPADEFEDEFERILDDDATEEEFSRGREAMSVFASRAKEMFGGLRRRLASAVKDELEDGGDAPKEKEKAGEEPGKADKPGEPGESGADASRRGRRQGSGRLETDREHLRSLEELLSRSEEEEDDFPEDEEPGQIPARTVRKEPQGTSEQNAARTEREEPQGTSGQNAARTEREEPQESSGQNVALDTGEEEPDRDFGAPDGKEDRDGARKPRRAVKKTRKPSRAGRTAGALAETVSQRFRALFGRLASFWEDLNQKGIHKREFLMLVIVVFFLLFLVLTIVSAIRGYLQQRRKSANVRVDEGVVVTVEDEPDSWCNRYPVRLKMFSNKTGITSVVLNGVTYEPDEDGMVTVETGDWLLEGQIMTDEGMKAVRVEIPKLDAEAPLLDMNLENGKIVLAAADTRSQVTGIYYAVVSPDDYLQIPDYRAYMGPITYEKGKVYRFYAKDGAGNRSVPVVTTLENAHSFRLNETEVSLFPEETYSLGVTAEPSGALLKNLTFESMDPNVLTVDENGKVTAQNAGTAAVRVSAEGLENQVCTFEVSEERTISISAIGDCTLGTDESFNTTTNLNAFEMVNGQDYFFRNVKGILEKDDVTFANLEGTLTDETAREAKQYAFKGDPSYVGILQSGSVEVVTLANNHSSDYGAQSLADTKQVLTDAEIDYCMGDEIVLRDVKGVKVAFIGIYVLDVGLERQSQVADTIQKARQMGAKIVVVGFHWGSEQENYPDETQKTLAHLAIDRGADLVVGHHPHVLQGIERYNGKYIVYSLGNFCFGGNSAPSDMDTMIFQQSFTVDSSGKVKDGEIAIYPCLVSSETGYNNYQPTPATGSAADRIIGRINEYSQEFGQTYTASE